MTSAIRQAFTEQRAADRRLRVVQPRRPVLAAVGRLAARAVGRLQTARTAVLQLGGLGLLDAAAWQFGAVWGLAVAGAALLLLDWLNGDQA